MKVCASLAHNCGNYVHVHRAQRKLKTKIVNIRKINTDFSIMRKFSRVTSCRSFSSLVLTTAEERFRIVKKSKKEGEVSVVSDFSMLLSRFCGVRVVSAGFFCMF